MNRFLLIVFTTAALCFETAAQEMQTVQGRVTSGDGNALPGVNVVVKGTTRGTSTDSEGTYSLRAAKGEVLVFTFIGYAGREVAISNQTRVDVVLEEDVSALKEVTIVSTGYQDIPKERATGSFVHLDSDLVERRVSTNILSRLEGISSGLIFNRTVEGRENDISIRGVSTIHSNAQPLIIVDNFPYDGELDALNPNDVESITILKDAAAASIWGARAGNGVIVITTRNGKYNEPLKLSFNANVTTTEKPDLFYYPQMSTSDFIDLERLLFERGVYTSRENSSQNSPITPAVELMIAERDGLIDAATLEAELDNLRQNDIRRDLTKHFYRHAVNQQYTLNARGGTDRNRYSFSAGFDKNAEALVGNQLQRITLNASNTWSTPNKNLQFTSAIYYTERKRDLGNEGTSAVDFELGTPYPYGRLKDDEGNNLALTRGYRNSFLDGAEQAGLLNWRYVPLDELAMANNEHHAVDYRINSTVRYKILEGLRADVLYQYWRSVLQRRQLYDERSYYVRDIVNQFTEIEPDGDIERHVPLGGILDKSTYTPVSQQFRAQLNYDRSWDEHHVAALAGYEAKVFDSESSSARYYGYDDELATNQVVDHANWYPRYHAPNSHKIPSNASVRAKADRFLSYYANAAYTLRKKYILSASGRKDQSNLFGVRANQRGVPLWSAGVAWLFHDEDFYPLPWMPYFKFRVTYGYSGNINKSISAQTTAYRIGAARLSGLPYAVVTNPPNPELRWERVKVFNLGIDFELKGRVLGGSVEYFAKEGLDLIGTRSYAPSTGIIALTGNHASTQTRGVDVTLNSVNVDRGFKWTSHLLFSYLSEKVTEYETDAAAVRYVINGTGATQTTQPFEGRPLYAVYSYPWAGLDPETGDPLIYLDGVPSSDYNEIYTAFLPETLVYHGSARPTVYGAVRNSFSWRNLSLSVNISFRGGYYFRRRSVYYTAVLAGRLDHADYARRWQKPGDDAITHVPSMPDAVSTNRTHAYIYSDALVEKGDHIRLQDINLTYTLSNFERLPVERVQIYGYLYSPTILWKATETDVDPDYTWMRPVGSVAFGVKVDF